jgi:hypothetical protein
MDAQLAPAREKIEDLDPNWLPRFVPATSWAAFVRKAQEFVGVDRNTETGLVRPCGRLGWDSYDLFACDPDHPTERVDRRGLIWRLIPNKRIVAISKDMAVIADPAGN